MKESHAGSPLVRFWGILTVLVVIFALYMAFIYAPTEREMGVVQRIFYFHVASAWNAFLAFFVVFVASITYLVNRKRRWDALAASSAEIGVLFTTLVLLTGPLWARPVWGVYWTWDPRLTTTLILWFIYVGYLLIRSSVEGQEQRGLYSAVFGILGFVDVPIVFFAIRWWRTMHPIVITAQKIDLAPSMVQALMVSVLAFSVLYVYLMLLRLPLERLADAVTELKETVRPRA